MTQTIPRSHSGLYPTLLGDSWPALPPAIRRLHSSPANVQSRGVFQVRRGTNRLARIVAFIAGMPKAGSAVDLRLVVSDQGDIQEWRRTFAGKHLVSLQRQRDDGLLLERMGFLELRFRLATASGALTYQSTGATLCLASLRIPLPQFLQPRVTAWEKAVGDHIHVFVEVNLPLLGRLICYEGELTQIEVH